MSHLVLELRPGETMFVNGATIRFRSRCRVELVSQARFLFGKQIMAEHEAKTAVGRLYYAVQTAYVGPADGKLAAMQDARARLDDLEHDYQTIDHQTVDCLRACLDHEDFYALLKIIRAMVQHERSCEPVSLS